MACEDSWLSAFLFCEYNPEGQIRQPSRVDLRGSYTPPSCPVSHTSDITLHHMPLLDGGWERRGLWEWEGCYGKMETKCFPENRFCIQEWRVEPKKGHKPAHAGILWLRRRRWCAREPGEGVERWPREMRQTQTSWLPRPSPVPHRAQGRLWKPAPFNFLLSDPCTQTHCQVSRL